ncbi:MAG: cytidine deaminase [Spirochaetaceae bacterium]|nr:MAG: cytidine deaminase [Spirochaetaceae bacterium]
MVTLEQAVSAAARARDNAYAPYSGFTVGAAIKVVDDDTFYVGCNVENASYGGTICAERSAIVHMVSRRGRSPVEYVVVLTGAEPPSVPCAICLQVLTEFCAADTPIHLADAEGVRRTLLLRELLPQPFVLV